MTSLSQIIRKYKNPAFNLRRRLNVEFVNETGVDSGGITWILFSLLMDRLTKGLLGGINLFEGMKGHLLPCRNYDMLSGKTLSLARKDGPSLGNKWLLWPIGFIFCSNWLHLRCRQA